MVCLPSLPPPAGPLSEVLFPIDNLTKQSKGFAFVTYMIPENAVSAMAQLDGHVFQVTPPTRPSVQKMYCMHLWGKLSCTQALVKATPC